MSADITSIQIRSHIHFIRGKSVIIDRNLAELYQVDTKVFNQAVKRNIERFPEDFMFQLSENEFKSLRSQFVTSNEPIDWVVDWVGHWVANWVGTF
jgi:hypothetical protein